MRFKTRTATFPLMGITLVFFLLQKVLGDGFTHLFWLSTADIFVRPWIIITSMFLHGSFTHLFFNMYVLMIFGPLLEINIGKKRFFSLYFLSGIIAGLGYAILSPNSFALGASGAIMGVLGVVIMLMPNLRVLFFFFIPMSLRTAGIIIALIDLVGFFSPVGTSGIAHSAHLFGLATGLFYGWYLLKQKKKFQTSFNTLKKYAEPLKRKHKKKKQQVRDADFTYSESIQLDDADIDSYLKNGRL